MSVASRGYAGRAVGEVYPHLNVEDEFVEPGEIDASALDVAFVAYPHMESAGIVRDLLEAGRRLVANPGCYPTAAVLALAPVVKRLKVSSVAINALSGVSGAGAKPTTKTHFVSANENVSPYGLADGSPRHRHTPEIEAVLRRVGEVPEVTFVPHLLPISRGELETIYVELADSGELPEVGEVLEWYAEDYEGWAFVEARDEVPQISHVANTNRARLSAALDKRAGKLLLFSAVDNLLKGASGAAVQNMNLALGFPEDAGLEHLR